MRTTRPLELSHFTLTLATHTYLLKGVLNDEDYAASRARVLRQTSEQAFV